MKALNDEKNQRSKRFHYETRNRSTKIPKSEIAPNIMTIGSPSPSAQFGNSQLFVVGLLVGFEILLMILYALDKLGTEMYRRGFAKPFYLKGHRIHHVCIYYVAPTIYAVFSLLLFLGYMRLDWDGLWLRIASMFLIAGATLAVDFLGDKYWPRIRKNAFWHHEWIYSIVPIYAMLYVVTIAL